MLEEWGPLGPLAGEWEGDGGLDSAYSNSRGEVISTPYREKATFKPFGPVVNGRQALYGLDYKTAMWRESEENPFHTEVGYWLWDSDAGEVVRGFVVPRGITVLAGGFAEADAKRFTLEAEAGHARYAIGENQYLSERASTRHYTVTVILHEDGTWSYDEQTMLKMAVMDEPFAHTDRNTLRRAADG